MPAMMAYWDTDEICRFANTVYLEWFGKSQSDMIDKMSMKELMGPLYDKNLPFIREAFKGNKQSFDIDITTPNGEVRHSHATYTPDILNGVVLGFIAHVADITDRKKLEVSNAKTEKLLRDLLEFAPDAIVIVDSTGTIQLVNQQAKNLFGYSRLEMLGKEIEFLIPGSYRAKHKTHIEGYFDSATIRPMGKNLKLFGKRKNGENFRVEVSLSPTQSEDGILVMAAIRDITERIRMETELEESYKRNSIFIEQSPNAIAMFDKEMRYMAASQKWIEDYDLKGNEIIGQSQYEIFPEITDEWKKIYQACLKGAIDQCDEAPFDRADGTRQWITWDVRPWYVSKGEIGGLLIYTADITHLKEKEQEKQRIEKILDETNEVARIGTWEVDIEKEKITWSRITREIHEVAEDFEPNMTTGLSFYKEGKNRDRISKAVSEAINKGISYDIEVELITGKGKEIWARAIGQSEFINGKCKRLYGIFQDISAIKNSEESLNQANEELNAIFNSGPIAIIGTDKNGIITHFNRGAEEMLQYTAEEMIGKNTPEIFHFKEEVVRRGEELSTQRGRQISGFDTFVENAKQGHHESLEWTYIKKDGSKLTVLLIVTALHDQNKEIVGFLGMATDVSERVEGERRLKEAKKDLEVLTERLTTQNTQLANFAHITSHNLRSPVSNLNSLLHFYNTSESREDKDMIFDKFETVIHHLSATLNTLVDTLKIRNEGAKKIEIVKFNEVLEKTEEIIVAQVMESGAQITADFSKVEEIEYNRDYLESIFLNLLTNAIKYRSPEVAPIIKIKTKLINNRIVMTISDNGLGIDLTRHGQKLFGLHKTFHRHAESKGIGLYLTKNHIEAMGGTITAESEVGKGTKFIINF